MKHVPKIANLRCLQSPAVPCFHRTPARSSAKIRSFRLRRRLDVPGEHDVRDVRDVVLSGRDYPVDQELQHGVLTPNHIHSQLPAKSQ